MGLVQSNIVDYERLRREKGAGAVVREVLDTHYAMSYDAVERQHADAVLWSETVYPTTFGHPKSEAGAELDREILGIVDAAGVPFVFGTYDRDAAGEYNAAAFVAPGTGLLGFYRKTRVFPLTEYVPAWLDGPTLRRWLPWTGTWRPGTGARVFPLRLADGREIPVLPLICLDDMDTGLAIDGARLGAQAILTLSNDSWFSRPPAGCRTAPGRGGVSQHRNTPAPIPRHDERRQRRDRRDRHRDRRGAHRRTHAGGRRRAGARPAAHADGGLGRLGRARGRGVPRAAGGGGGVAHVARSRRGRSAGIGRCAQALPADVAVLPPAARLAAGLLRAFARGSLLWMGAALLLGDGALQANTARPDAHFRRTLSRPRGRRVVRAARFRRAGLDRATARSC